MDGYDVDELPAVLHHAYLFPHKKYKHFKNIFLILLFYLSVDELFFHRVVENELWGPEL